MDLTTEQILALWDKRMGASDPEGFTTSHQRNSVLKLTGRIHPVSEQITRDINKIDPQLRTAIRELVVGRSNWPLYLDGSPGTGKTAAVLCLCDSVPGSVYYRFPRLIKDFNSKVGVSVEWWHGIPYNGDYNDVRYTLKKDSLDEREFFDFLVKSPLLVIDDLATRSQYTDAQYDNFYELIDTRQRKPMIAVSNKSLNELAAIFDDRIVSRLAAGSRFRLEGRDRRIS